MDATRPTLRARAVAVAASVRENRPRLQAGAILSPVAWSLAGALFLCSIWLLLRRLTGALTEPLGGAALLTIGFCAALAAAAARLLWQRTAHETPAFARRFRNWSPTVALVFVVTAAAVPGSSALAIAQLWAMIAAEEVAVAWISRLPKCADRGSSIVAKQPSGERSRIRRPTHNGGALEQDIGGDVWQHYTRQRATNGQELVHGVLRASYVAGQRIAIEHLSFCPMLATVPQLTVVVLDESDCTVRATHVYRYGARLEIRLREPCDEPAELLVRYEARC